MDSGLHCIRCLLYTSISFDTNYSQALDAAYGFTASRRRQSFTKWYFLPANKNTAIYLSKLRYWMRPLAAGGEGGIRTPGTLFTYTRFPGEHLRPLRHLSMIHWLYAKQPFSDCLRIIIPYPFWNTSKIYFFAFQNFSIFSLIIFFTAGQNKATDSWECSHGHASRSVFSYHDPKPMQAMKAPLSHPNPGPWSISWHIPVFIPMRKGPPNFHSLP